MLHLLYLQYHLVLPRVAIVKSNLSKGRYDETFAGEDASVLASVFVLNFKF